MIRHSYAKSFQDFKIRILAKITALTAVQFINKFIFERLINNIKTQILTSKKIKMKKKITLLISLYFLCLATKAQTYQWAKKIGGGFNTDQINTMTTDNQGNILVAGFFNESMDADPGPGHDAD